MVIRPKADEVSRQLWALQTYDPDHSYLLGYFDGLCNLHLANMAAEGIDHEQLYKQGYRDGEGDRERWEEEHGFK